MPNDSKIIDQLYQIISANKKADPKISYTAKLFSEGRNKIVRKLGEESVETLIAALSETQIRLVSESADLLYHLLVLWADCDIKPTEVWDELERRQGISGIVEKNVRKNLYRKNSYDL
ncbi:MAG: phosphoribosyl-ATP diphosphatase [Rhodospirillaceae bacterium]|jgi:phosphoribosyl-ATP pyrophosphohydrolase|nr:phosphoribosyl-ATP diphosphatase [Rhodospirillaceae bacterium]